MEDKEGWGGERESERERINEEAKRLGGGLERA